jgi:hypothetical protein
LPREISTLVYFLSIGIALLRHAARITELDDNAIRDGLLWAQQPDWVDDVTRSLIEDGLKGLDQLPKKWDA